MVTVAILGNHPSIGDERTKTVVGILAALAQSVVTQHQFVGLIKDVLASGGNMLVLAVDLLCEIAPAVVGVGGLGLPAVGGALGNLIQVVENVVHVVIGVAVLIGQVA